MVYSIASVRQPLVGYPLTIGWWLSDLFFACNAFIFVAISRVLFWANIKIRLSINQSLLVPFLVLKSCDIFLFFKSILGWERNVVVLHIFSII